MDLSSRIDTHLGQRQQAPALAFTSRTHGLLPRLLLMAPLAFWFLSCSPVTKDQPNILLLTLDTTRSNFLGCYGHSGGTSPHLDGLADAGVRFARARCQVPITLPSHTSILTGTYPITHGSHQHTDRFSRRDLQPLASILQHHGYQTTAFISARVLDRHFGLDRGFSHYDDDIGTLSDGRRADYRRAAQVTAAAREWFEKRPAGPYFAWFHFYDPHLPHDPPEPFRTRFATDLYAGEIAYMDAQIGALLTWLRQRGELENTLVVAIADHGESRGEHSIRGHTEFVYQEVLRIPFLLSWPGRIPAGKVIPDLVRTIDLLPTILDYARLEIPELVQGQSLRSLIEDRGPEPARMSLFESRYLENLFGWAPLVGIERWPHKLIRAPDSELYDLSRDPGEEDNLHQARGELARELSGLLDTLLSSSDVASPGENDEAAEIDPETRQSLASLGYVAASSGSHPAAAGHEDPKNHLESVSLHQRLMRGPDGSSEPDHLRDMNRLALLEPDQPRIQILHGDYLRHAGDLQKAVAAYLRAAELAPDDPEPLLELAGISRSRGEFASEMEFLAAARECAPENTGVLGALAERATRDGDHEEAGRLYRQALRFDPDSVLILGQLAATLVLTGRPAEAEPYLRDSLARPAMNDHELAFRLYLLGRVLYVQSRDPVEAAQYLRQAASRAPGMAGPDLLLALLAADAGRTEEAATHARRYLELAPDSEDAARMHAIIEDSR